MNRHTNNSESFQSPGRRRWPWPRIWALALVALRQGLRMRLWILVPPAVIVLVLADLSSPRFDPVFEGVPAAVSTSLLVMTVLAVVVGIFFATSLIPGEMESKVAYSVATKPVTAAEIVAGKVLGMSLLLAIMLAFVALGAYAYIEVRASAIRSMAAGRLAELQPRATHPADLNALQAVAERGPLMTYRYQAAVSGPEAGIELGPDWKGPRDAQWVLAETGMRLSWRLADTPLRQWAAAGPCRLSLALLVEQSAAPAEAAAPSGTPSENAQPGAPAEEPPRVLVALQPAEPELARNQAASAPAAPVFQDVFDVPPSGDLVVPVAAAEAPPVKGVLNVPPEGDLVLHLLAMKRGMLAGVRPGSLKILRPGGREHLVQAAPETGAAEMRRRVMLAGRSRTPRETALFHFAGVEPEWLGSGDTAFEVGFSLDAWAPPTVQAEGRITFTRADGRELALLFHPESHHSTLLYLDRAFWHGGPLDVRLECLTDEDYFGLVADSLRLRLDGGPYALHFAQATARVWLFGTVLVAAGILFSTRLSWFVSILSAIAFFVLVGSRDFLLRALSETAAHGWQFGARLKWLASIPDILRLLPGEGIITGQSVPLGEMGAALGEAALTTAVLLALGAWLLRGREVAA
jgi:hypothetical protein